MSVEGPIKLPIGRLYCSTLQHICVNATVCCDRIPAKKEPCLTPTLMDEGQARNPNTTYNGY